MVDGFMRWVVLLASIFATIASAMAQEPARIALLIGNQAYDASVGVLQNPYNDIRVVGAALRQQGFEVLPEVKDGRRSAILGAVRQLRDRLISAGAGAVGFVYYSGHGAAEVDTGINYLIPVDAKQPGSSEFWDDSLKLDDILKLLDGARGAAKFIVFDACRNELRVPAKSTTKGLVPVAEQQGMLIAYATAPGRTASDQGQASGPFAAALAAELVKPGLDHLNLFQNVKEAVLASTKGVQQPWINDGLARRVQLTRAVSAQVEPRSTGTASNPQSEAALAWATTQNSTSIAVLQAFAKRHAGSTYADMAEARIQELRSASASAVPAVQSPPSQPSTGGRRTEIIGAGATFPFPVYQKWSDAYIKISGVGLSYQPIGSGGGIKQIQARTVTFGASDIPLSQQQLEQSGDLMQWPMVMGAVVPVINVPGVRADAMVLDGPTLARIFGGQITNWDDPAIKVLNPGLSLPNAPIAVVRRADGSGTTFLFTSYLSKVSPDWQAKIGKGTSVEWPVGAAAKGNDGIGTAVQGTGYSIGYVEWAYALQNRLVTVRLKNMSGNAVAVGKASIQAAAAAADWGPHFANVLATDPGDAASWPLSAATFVLMHRSAQDATEAKTALAFFAWCLDQGQSIAESLEYAPMPQNVVRQIKESWRQMKSSDGRPVL